MNYLAITIGPLYKTILQARSTRDLWASSYFFSALMREILFEAERQKMGVLLSPAMGETDDHIHGAGIYPDRAFWRISQTVNAEIMQGIFFNACAETERKTGIASAIISRYAHYSAVTLTIDEGENTNAILELNRLLDTAELYERASSNTVDFVEQLDDNIQDLYIDGHTNLNTWAGNIFIEYNCGKEMIRLPSIIELCTRELKYKNGRKPYYELVTDPISKKVCSYIKDGKKRYERLRQEQEQETELMQALKENYDDFGLRHKYIAFVYADGDNMGKCINAIGNDEVKINQFSNGLKEFAKNAAKLIVDYGGIPIFIGGDDLLFALPVNNGNDNNNGTGKTIFGLIDAIDKHFLSKDFDVLSGLKDYPASLSYGIGISYYKYPMADALQAAHNALDRIKHSGQKNRLAFEVQKHSGQLFGGIMNKGKSLRFFLENLLEKDNSLQDDNFLTSTIHKFKTVRVLYEDAIINDSLDYFFTNHLNEKIHKDIRFKNEKDNYLEAVKLFTKELYYETNNAATAFDILFACLRMYQFLNQPDHE